MLNADTVASAGINGRKMVMSQERQKRCIFAIWLCFYQFWVNFTHFHVFLSNFKLLNADKAPTKWHQPESMVRNGKEPGTAKKKKKKRWIFAICLCFYQCWFNFTHFSCFLSNFKMLNTDKVASAAIHGRTCQWVRNSNKDAIFMIWLCFYQYGLISPIFSQILQYSRVTKWHQPEFMAANGNESGKAKKMPCLRSD